MSLLDLFNDESTATVGTKRPKGGLWYPENGDKSQTYAVGKDNTMPPMPKGVEGDTWVLGIPSGVDITGF